MMRRLAARLEREDDGFTLAELMVAMLVLMVVGTIAVTGLVQGMQTSRYSQDRGDALEISLLGMERLSREIRAADPLRTAAPDEVAIDVHRDGRLYHYQYRVEAEGLVEERWQFNDSDADPMTDSPDAVSESLLIGDLESANVFEFFDASGNPGASAGEARSVRIVIERAVDDDSEPIVVETKVTVRNA